MILKTTGGKDTYPMDRNRWHRWEVKIPPGVSCDHCILQVVNFKNVSKQWLKNYVASTSNSNYKLNS